MKRTSLPSNDFAKYLILPFLLLPFCIACNMQSDKGTVDTDILIVDPIEGVWELTNSYFVKDGDTLYSDPGQFSGQHKMYCDGYVMWTDNPKADSSEWHGFGTYKLSDDTLIEELWTMSLPVKEKMGSKNEVLYSIEYDASTCKQTTETIHRSTDYLFIKEWKKLN